MICKVKNRIEKHRQTSFIIVNVAVKDAINFCIRFAYHCKFSVGLIDNTHG